MRINNLFDRRYYTAGTLAENPFDAAGAFQTNSDDWTRETFFALGAPLGSERVIASAVDPREIQAAIGRGTAGVSSGRSKRSPSCPSS